MHNYSIGLMRRGGNGGNSKGGGSRPTNGPSTTGKRSGSGRGNNPPKK